VDAPSAAQDGLSAKNLQYLTKSSHRLPIATPSADKLIALEHHNP
jgi:hypothetical protein